MKEKNQELGHPGYLKSIAINVSLLMNIWQLIVTNKKWWLIPFFIVFAFVSLFIVLVGGTTVLPAIYAIF